MKKRFCLYCKQDISDLHYSVVACYRPECREKFEADRRLRMRESQQRYYEKHLRHFSKKPGSDNSVPRKTKYRICKRCQGEIKNGNWWFCEACEGELSRINQRIDGEWLYV